MKFLGGKRGFTLIEAVVAAAVFLLFALGIYGGISLVFKIVYQSRLKILETALLSEELESARNLPFDSVGIQNGVPAGVLARTKSVVRNGVTFLLTTTVRNIDNTFDGMATGTPTIDTSPGDYKLVEISAICSNCSQVRPVILSTLIAPKKLEGASTNGHLYIQVFDANGGDVAGANVHVVNTARTPNTIIDDVTGNDGWLRIIDTPTGTLSYNITVSKGGYSSDYTAASSVDNPNPVKPPANVVSQTVTELSFSIDRVGSINLHSIGPTCLDIGSVGFNLHGTKVLGVDPNIYKFSQNFTTNGSGDYSFSDQEWDTYYLAPTGVSYDIAGTIPMSPLNLTPGLSQEFYAILRPHTSNSLLVKVKDAGTGLPLSDAAIHLTGTSFDDTLSTSLGYSRQTDWSGGSGQVSYVVENQYFSGDGNLDTNSPVGDLKLRKTGGIYLGSGYLESSTFDLGSGVSLRNLEWEPLSQPVQTGANSIVFQLAASNSSSPAAWDFIGPDGTPSTFYTATNTVIYSGLSNQRYLRYRVFLSTADNHYTPQLSEVAITYTSDCTPPGQVFFSGLSAGTYTLEVSHNGYTTNSGSIDISGSGEAVINLSPQE